MSNEKMGRPTERPKKTKIEFRADDETVSKLDECVTKLESNRSEVIRESISQLHKKIIK